MRFSTYIALFTSSAAAQSSVSLFNLFEAASTLTQIGADATATTYKHECPPDNAGITGVPSQLRPKPDSPSATITPAPTPRARLARQAVSDDEPDYSFCEPYALKQGPSTWELHLKDPSPGAWTIDMNCNWQGAITAADLTCTITQSGYVPVASVRGINTSIIPKSDMATMEAINAVTIVSASGAVSAAASQTPSGSRSASSAPSASGSPPASQAPSGSASGSAGAAQSTGLGPAGPLPTGAIMFVGGAAGLFAVALAL